ncbi:high mobility group box domain-containing protein, partial [Gymnopilus junonius]
PRPPNSWILYRAHALKNLPPPGPGEGRRSQSEVSALVSNMWRHESESTKSHFERLAEEAKAQHKIQFPDYRYQPKKKEEK